MENGSRNRLLEIQWGRPEAPSVHAPVGAHALRSPLPDGASAVFRNKLPLTQAGD